MICSVEDIEKSDKSYSVQDEMTFNIDKESAASPDIYGSSK